jgi:hypothetical protein
MAEPQESTAEKVEEEIGYFGARLREPSTYASLGAVIGAAVLFHFVPAEGAQELIKDIMAAGIAIGGIIGVFLPDPGSKA